MEGWSPSTRTFANGPLIPKKVRLTELGRQIPNSYLTQLSLLSQISHNSQPPVCHRGACATSQLGGHLCPAMKPPLILHPSGDTGGWYVPRGSAWPQQFHLWMPRDEPESGTNECANSVHPYPLYTRLTISQWENKQLRYEFSWKSWHTSFRIERSREKTRKTAK